ncbi:hypothetical protein ACF3NT_04155 [Naumannella halotolerans]|uniref:DUF4352 domain-containing protein n=1 Tax=Naumannella halotolerans TaxID=993414 RepID=A0A4R7J9H7_9ACTN|nr:hypothetical protein [Naumannella halotolerans]TDT33247.1 hypothetical protein CLV29_0852 [Naumannella halotolerans]
MNPYKTAAIAVAAVVGVSSGAFAAFNLDGSDQVAPPVASASPSATPEGASPTPTESPSSAAPTEDPDKEASSEATSESAGGDTDGGGTDNEDPAGEGTNGSGDGAGSGSDHLSVQVDSADLLGSGDPDAQPLLVTVTVCVDSVPSGDSDGLVDVRSTDFWIDQTGNDAHSGPALSTSERNGVGEGDTFPDLVSLSQGECATGDLVFMSGLDVDSTTMTFSNDYSEQLTFDIATD